MTFHQSMTRRTLLGGGLALGAGAALSACQTGGGGNGGGGGNNNGSGAGNSGAVKPDFIPYDGPKPDLVGDGATGVPNGFLSYPDPPPSTGRVPLELSAPVEMMIQGIPSKTAHDRNEWWKMFEADFGAELKLSLADSTKYTAKFQTTVAGGDIPEITQIVSVPQLPQLLEKVFTDLTPYLSGDNIKKYPNLASTPSAAWDMCTINGKLWGVTNPRIVAGSVMMTRGDLLEAKGIPLMPELSNGEDFLDMCRELTDRDGGVFAIGQIPQNWTLPLIMEALGGPNGWKVDGGTWTSAYESPEYEQALEIVTKMYSEGLFHPNTYSDLSSTAVWFDGGVTALFAQNFASWQGRAAEADFPCGAVVMPKWDGGGAASKHLGVPGYGAPVGLAKTDDEDRIDELLRVADYLASPFGTEEYLKVKYGVRDRQYTLSDGQVKIIEDAPEELVSGPYYYGAQNAVSLYSPGKPDVTKQLFAYCEQQIPSGVPNPQYGKFSETALSKGAGIDRTLNDVMGNIVQGRAKLSEWPAAVKKWKADGGDTIAEEYAAN